jgi:protoporphyrinogen oxidase
MNVAIIGAGFCGLSAAYEIAKAGHNVEVFERDASIGGLASTFEVGGQELEKFYHHWLATDKHIFDFAKEIGMEDKLQFKESKVGIYYANQNYKFSSPTDLLKFTPLPFFSRIRFGLSIIYSWMLKNTYELEKITAEDWLKKITGENNYNIIWKPLLIGKFGKEFYRDVAAIWIWNKLIQRGKSRDKSAKEKLGYYQGGFSAFINDLSNIITTYGGKIYVKKQINNLKINEDHSINLKINENWQNFDRVVYTGHTPELAELLEKANFENYANDLKKIKYMANICLILETSQSLSDSYWLNITDPSFPFVGIIEHTNFEDKENYAGKHLIYLSKYVPRDNYLYKMNTKEITEFSIPHIKRLFPSFNEKNIKRSFLWKADYAQPLIVKNYRNIIPKVKSDIKNFYLSTMAQVYPEDRGTNYAVYHGRNVGKLVVKSLEEK